MSFMMTGTRNELEKRMAEWEAKGIVPVSDIVTTVKYARHTYEDRHHRTKLNVMHNEKCAVRMADEKEIMG